MAVISAGWWSRTRERGLLETVRVVTTGVLRLVCTILAFSYTLYKLENKSELGDNIYCHFVLVFTKNS
jgi:hypothetical protein